MSCSRGKAKVPFRGVPSGKVAPVQKTCGEIIRMIHVLSMEDSLRLIPLLSWPLEARRSDPSFPVQIALSRGAADLHRLVKHIQNRPKPKHTPKNERLLSRGQIRDGVEQVCLQIRDKTGEWTCFTREVKLYPLPCLEGVAPAIANLDIQNIVQSSMHKRRTYPAGKLPSHPPPPQSYREISINN